MRQQRIANAQDHEVKQMKRIHSITALSFSMFAFASAMAADGYVTGEVNMRAGPDSSYPSVVMLGSGTEVSIQGCVDGWSWCDVAAGGNRGWVAGSYLQENYQGQRVYIPSYGVQIGIPIIAFVFGAYWDNYYRNRPWYGQREHWSHVTPNYRPVAVRNDYHHNETAVSRDHGYGAPANDAGPSRASNAPATNHQPRSSTVAVTPTTPHATTSTAVTSQHHTPPVEHSVTQARVSAPHTTPTHTAPTSKTLRPASTEKSAPKKEGGEDKGQH
jgi:uncharacterized protein YraI